MDLYGQERDVGLLVALVSRLAERSVIDVGAERGSFVESLLRGGATDVHAIEPEPSNAAALRERFHGDSRVSVLEYAITAADGPVQLRKSVSPSGEPIPFGHTLYERPDTDEIAWRGAVTVEGRSLASLISSGELPSRVGILKVDTEGGDLHVLAGMGDLRCDVVMVEHWLDLPHSLGRCPWTINDLNAIVRSRGFLQFACLEHRGEFELLRWNDADIGVGRSANLLFLHEDALPDLLPALLEVGAAAAEDSVEVGERYAAAAHARLAVIEELQLARAAADARAAAAERPVPERPVRRRRGTGRLSRELRLWMRPRIGTLHHHDPRPLKVPARYRSSEPPTPAPTISLVTPSYQQGRFLERTLYSVLSQGYPALEYIVQDGGSTDETVDVLRRFDSALSLWRTEPDRGQADAINRAFGETTGEIMAWLNADDLLLPGSLAYVARYFAKHRDVDVVYGNRIMIDENDGQIGKWIMPSHSDHALRLADYVPQETLFWRRSIWEAVGSRVDERFSYALDWDLLLRFSAAGARMVRLPRYLGAFRVHPEQKTTALLAMGAIECDLIRQRLHGRPVLTKEAFDRLKPYLVKSMLVDMGQRVIDRFGGARMDVVTFPPAEFMPPVRPHAAANEAV